LDIIFRCVTPLVSRTGSLLHRVYSNFTLRLQLGDQLTTTFALHHNAVILMSHGPLLSRDDAIFQLDRSSPSSRRADSPGSVLSSTSQVVLCRYIHCWCQLPSLGTSLISDRHSSLWLLPAGQFPCSSHNIWFAVYCDSSFDNQITFD